MTTRDQCTSGLRLPSLSAKWPRNAQVGAAEVDVDASAEETQDGLLRNNKRTVYSGGRLNSATTVKTERWFLSASFPSLLRPFALPYYYSWCVLVYPNLQAMEIQGEHFLEVRTMLYILMVD